MKLHFKLDKDVLCLDPPSNGVHVDIHQNENFLCHHHPLHLVVSKAATFLFWVGGLNNAILRNLKKIPTFFNFSTFWICIWLLSI